MLKNEVDSQHKRTMKFKRMRQLINVTKQHKCEGTPMISKEFAEEWADALESGMYEQGDHSLYDSANKTYCGLGVACAELGIRNDFIADEGMPSGIYNLPVPEAKDVDGWSIKQEVRVPYMLQTSDREDDLASIGDALALCNDSGWSFKSIAMFIRRYLG